MKNIFTLIVTTVFAFASSEAQNVGIGTTSPLARLHITDSSVLFSATGGVPAIPGDPPVSGGGRRMMWYADKAAFRAGYESGNNWDKDNVGYYSIGLGADLKAGGLNSVAMGFATNSSGDFSTALGYTSLASGNASTAMGTSIASGNSSTAMGISTASGNASTAMGLSIASGNSSTAMGRTTTASGYASTATGNFTAANGEASIAMGRYTQANEMASTAMGNGAIADGYASTAMGNSTIASGYASTTMGLSTTAKAYGALSVGVYNDISDNPNPVTPATTDRIFQIGNGTTVAASNAITVLRNGNTGIGIVNPDFRLDVGARMRIRSTPGLSAGLWLNNDANSVSPAFIGMRTDDQVGFYGQTGTFGWRFYVNTTDGNAWLQGALTQNSDIRLKKDIIPLQNSLQKIMKLGGYHYYWTNINAGKQLQTGVLAQEVQKLFPELVTANEEGILAVNYSGLIPVMIESIKEQQQQIDELKKIVQQLLYK